MTDFEREKAAYILRFDLERGERYYQFFAARWETVGLAERVLGFLLFAASAALGCAGCGRLNAGVALAGAVGFVLDYILNVGRRRQANINRQKALSDLRLALPADDKDVTEGQVAATRRAMSGMSLGEAEFPCVSVLCHNDLVFSRYGFREWSLSAWQRIVGSVFPIRYNGERVCNGPRHF